MENLSVVFDQRLNIEFLQSIYEDDIEHALVVFSQFIQMAPSLMKEIEASYESGAVEPFRQKVHKIKPVFSFVGLTQLTAKAEILEKKCEDISLINELDDQYKEFKNQYFEGFPIIQNEVKRLEKQIN